MEFHDPSLEKFKRKQNEGRHKRAFASFGRRTIFPDLKGVSPGHGANSQHQAMANLETKASAIVDAIEAGVSSNESAVSLTPEQVAILRQFLFVASYRKRSRFSTELHSVSLGRQVQLQVDEHLEKYKEADAQEAFFHNMLHIMEDSPEDLLHDKAVLPVDRALYFQDCQERRLAIYVAPLPLSFVCSENGFGFSEEGVRLFMPWSNFPFGALWAKEYFEACIIFPMSPRILIMLLPPTSLQKRGASLSCYLDIPTIGDLWPESYFSDFPTAQYPHFMPSGGSVLGDSNKIRLRLQPLTPIQLSQVNAYLIEHCEASTKVAYKAAPDVYSALLAIKNDKSLPLNFPRTGRPDFAMLKDYGNKQAMMRLKGGGFTTFWRWMRLALQMLWPFIVWYGVYRVAERGCRSYFRLSVFQAGYYGLSSAAKLVWDWTIGMIAGWFSLGLLWGLVKKAMWYIPWLLGVLAIVAKFF